MRTITVKYAGECRKCGITIEIGKEAVYEKHVGIFCPSCAPVDSEEIRAYRQEAGNRRADKYDEWANKREQKAESVFKESEHFRGDIAFNTQPGHIPFRARLINREDRAIESLRKAEKMRSKADNLRHVRVKGDAAKHDEKRREAVRLWIQPGMMVDTCHAGIKKVFKVNKKTATVGDDNSQFTHDLMFLSQVKQ